MSLLKEDKETIDKAARLIAGGHSDVAHKMLAAMMTEVAIHYQNAGTGAREHWLEALKALGNTCLTLYQMLHASMKK